MRLGADKRARSAGWAFLTLLLASGVASAEPTGPRWVLSNCDAGSCPAANTCVSGRCTPVVRIAESIGNRSGTTIKGGVRYNDFVAAVKQGFTAWTSGNVTECKTSYDIAFGDSYREKKGPEAIDSSDGLNVVIVLEGGDWTSSSSTLALTHTSYLVPSNMLVNGDLEINGNASWATDGRSGAFDMQSVVTHEAGHFLGLGHRTEEASIMYASIARGSIKRTLGAIDSTDVCKIYPKADGTGCSSASSPGDAMALGAAALWLFVLSRRQPGASAPASKALPG